MFLSQDLKSKLVKKKIPSKTFPAYDKRPSFVTYLEGFLCCQSKHNLLFFIPYIYPDNRSCSMVTVPLQVKCREFDIMRLRTGRPYDKSV